MAGKKKANRLFIEVLQNGFSVCSHQLPLNRRATVTLGTDSKATLTLPHYPLPARVELLTIDKHGAHLEARANWDGFVTSSGEVVDLAAHKGTSMTLRSGDYGTLFYGDLQILLRLGKDWQLHYRKEKRRCQPGLFSLAFYSAVEKKVLALAVLVAAITLAPALYFVNNMQSARPSSLADLRSEYIHSFMYPEHFSTIPEALQNRLDRTNYPKSTIGYYRSLADLLVGWPISAPNLLFDTSEEYFGRLHTQRQDTVDKLSAHQQEYEVGFLAKPQAAMIDIATVKGESVRQTALRLFDKIDLQHDSLRSQLDRRRKTRALWDEVPEFNPEDYKKVKTADQKAAEEKLSKISPFHMESNESNMYRLAKDWAERTRYRRKIISLNSAPKEPLLSEAYQEVYVPESMNFASFLQKAAVLANEDKLAGLQASVYGATPAAKIKEPLIGEIDPKLIRKTVEDNWHGLRLCYELALRRDKKLSGEMEWRWRIDSRGDISDIELVTTTIGDNRMLNCIKSKMGVWRFPPPRRGSVQVRYPFRFSKTKG